MKSRKRPLRVVLYCATILVCTFIATTVGNSEMGRWIELRTYDLRFKLRGPLPQSETAPVTLLAIDEESLTKIPEPLMLWHRAFARAINRLVSRGAAVIGIDFIFADVGRYDPEGERMLSASLLQAGAAGVPIILAYRIRAEGAEQPSEAVRIAALAAGHTLAFANLTTDSDDFVRRQEISAIGEGNQQEPGLALGVADAFAKKTRLQFSAPGSADHTILINYRGANHFKRISFATLAQEAEDIDEAESTRFVRNHIVLIGRVGQAGDEDLHSTPQYFSANSTRAGGTIRTPGVEIHANAITTLLERKDLRTLAPSRQLLVTLSLIIVVSVCCYRFIPVLALVLSAVFVLVFLSIASYGAFKQGWWVLVVPPVSGAVLAIGAAEVTNYMLEGREKRALRNLFQRYVNDKVIEKILQSPQSLTLAGERKLVTVLFADIREFTARSEKMTAESLVKDLNEYFTAMVAVIQEHNGMVDKFIGDGLMAIFGTPMEDPEAPLHCVLAGIGMIRALKKLNLEFERRGIKPISIGIGIHTGEAVVGNIGSVQKMEYTAMGDVVNLASRIEGLNKKLGTEILVSGETQKAIGGRIDLQSMGEETVKGRTHPVSIYTLASPLDPSP